ncbi:MAG: hypothetical protein K2Q23_06595, partial [Bryobacteraceae bacterium]|nr:hypothetical protein [Bryobacteraceae bacterium]
MEVNNQDHSRKWIVPALGAALALSLGYNVVQSNDAKNQSAQTAALTTKWKDATLHEIKVKTLDG